jgi:hypothetical protein
MSAACKVIVEQLNCSHDVSNFVCAVEPALESFLREKALSLHQKNVCTVYLVRGSAGELYGYFTLSPTAVYQESMSNTQARKFSYNPISAMLLGQFARDVSTSPKGFGATLLREAFTTALVTPGWQILAVDPFSEASEKWFLELGFRQVRQHYPTVSSDHPTKRLKLYMTRNAVMATLKALSELNA